MVPLKPVQVYEALPEEKKAVRSHALKRPEIRHREIAWRILDENVISLSSSTVYRILLAENLLKRHRRRQKRYREDRERASRSDQMRATDLMDLKIGHEQYFVIAFIDEYSRHLVRNEVTTSMGAITLSTIAQAALHTLPMDSDGRITIRPIICSDIGSGYLSRKCVEPLEYQRPVHHRIRPHFPEVNRVMERATRAVPEKRDDYEVASRKEAVKGLESIICNYNNEQLHNSLGSKTPATHYQGSPDALDQVRKQNLREARHRRNETYLQLWQWNFPSSKTEEFG